MNLLTKKTLLPGRALLAHDRQGSPPPKVRHGVIVANGRDIYQGQGMLDISV